MAITNEQAMQELLNLQRAADSARAYETGLFTGTVCAYWRSGTISFEQYRQLVGMNEEQEPA